MKLSGFRKRRSRSRFMGVTGTGDSMHEDFAALASREEVKDQLTRLFVSMDEERWADAADCFAEKVLLDLSSIGAGKPNRTTRKKAAETLEAGLKGLAA